MLGFVTSRPRLFAGLLCGLVAYPLLPHAFAGADRGICAWDVGVAVYLASTLVLFAREPVEKMADNARAQQEGEWTIFWITVAVVTASFVVIFQIFSGLKDMSPVDRRLHVALVAFTLFASWLMTHVTFSYRYAHEYYEIAPGRTAVDGGLEFPGKTVPDYFDFLYFSVVLGMTFQVSDVQISSRKLRRLALLHGLLSFLFNAVIISLSVNIAASLL